MGKYDYKKLSKKKSLTEKELNALKNHLNRISSSEAYDLMENTYDSDGVKLSSAQVQKGRKWLYNLGFTPTGKERKNSPFGYREEYIVKNFKSLELLYWHDAGSFFSSFYVPVYQAIGKDGTTMDYYVSGGKIQIIG